VNHWNTILAHAHKVPGLEVFDTICGEVKQESDRVYVATTPARAQNPFAQRVALLKIVDAIESAGLARFERIMVSGDYWWQGAYDVSILDDYVSLTRYVKAHGPQEHLALLECVAKTLEAIPDVCR
jgi:hypothetical protein